VDVADPGSFANGDFAGVGLLLAANNGQQGRFADAVGTDQANAVAVVHGEEEVFEKRNRAESFRDVLRGDDRRHGSSLRTAAAHSNPSKARNLRLRRET